MESPGPFQQPVSTPVGSPLRQLSADQINQQRIPQSPSMPNFSNENERPSYHRSRESISSDVRSKVDFLNSLSNPSSPTKANRQFALPQAPSNAALQRAMLGFEESQASLASANAEIERLKEQLKVGKNREKLVSERIESLIDQLSTERESRNNDKKHYIAEVKKCRKQAYQAELSQLETQETLKEVKQELRRAQAEVTAERAKKEEARQEAFERAYAVSGLTEELETLKTTLKAMENERDAALLEVRRNAVADVTMILTEDHAVQTSPEKAIQPLYDNEDVQEQSQQSQEPRHMSTAIVPHDVSAAGQNISQAEEPLWSEFVARDQCLRDLHDEPFTYEDHIRALYEEIQATRDEIVRQREQIEHMHLQCQDGSCDCKRAEKRGDRYVFDQSFEDFRQERATKKRKLEQDRRGRQRPLPILPPTDPAGLQIDPSIAEAAVNIPLPSPAEHEFGLKSKDPSPEPTAVLEEMTQVMVEAGKEGHGTTPFVFSTSVSAYTQDQPEIQMPEGPHLTDDVPDLDMFDISEAKDHPPRPSTAMGILSVPSPERSPIRLVPDSPDVRSLPPDSVMRDSERLGYTSQTVRVALKDSPHRNHRRAESRPNIRSHSHNRSPLHQSETNHPFEKANSASPAASTIFPITPVPKHHHRHETHQQTVTTITTIPLRDASDDSLSYNTDFLTTTTPASSARIHHHHHDHASTQPIATSMTHADMLSGITGTPVSRDAALAQIRARRDRARSLNMKKMETVAGSKTPGSARRGIQLKENAIVGGGIGVVGRDNTREVSVTSVQTAPGRF